MFNILNIRWIKRTFREREVMDGIQYIGFARPIFAHNAINRSIECKIYLSMVLKIEKAQAI